MHSASSDQIVSFILLGLLGEQKKPSASWAWCVIQQ
jgi:hypothetical protein